MSDPITTAALTAAIDNSTKVANTPLFSTVIDRLVGFKISEWKAQGDVIKKQITDGYEEAKQKGLGFQYASTFRESTNLINVGIKATEYIDNSKSNNISLDNDFFWGIIDHAKKISDEEVQELIAKILAGEYNSPGTYAMSTLQILKSLGKNEIEKFSLLGAAYLPDHGFMRSFFSMDKDALSARQEIGIDYSDFLEMQNLGLIQSGDYTMQITVEKDKEYRIEYAHGWIIAKALEEKNNWNFPNCYQLTTAGKQIWQYLEKKESMVFREWLKSYLKKESLLIVD